MEDLDIIKQKLSRNWELVESDITSKDAKYYRTIYPEAKIEIRTCLFGSIKNKSIELVYSHNIINNSKKTLSKYLEIIKENMEIKKYVQSDQKIWYNLFSSKTVLFPIRASPKEPFDDVPIERNSEILVSIPHLTPNYFVLCTS